MTNIWTIKHTKTIVIRNYHNSKDYQNKIDTRGCLEEIKIINENWHDLIVIILIKAFKY
jgi:hypothetical protein